MSLRDVALIVGGLVVGALLGHSLSGSKLDGRLSACKDIMSVLNQSLPLQLECTIEKGDVYVSSPLKPGVKVSLDGSKVIQ